MAVTKLFLKLFKTLVDMSGEGWIDENGVPWKIQFDDIKKEISKVAKQTAEMADELREKSHRTSL